MLIGLLLVGSLGFATQEEAATAAVSEAVKVSGKYEYGGVIWEKDGEYFYSIPQTSKSSVRVDYAVTLPGGAKLKAIYHTHPRIGAFPDRFSVGDIALANRMNVTSYIGIVRDNNMISYDPTKTRITVTMKNPSDTVDYSPNRTNLL